MPETVQEFQTWAQKGENKDKDKDCAKHAPAALDALQDRQADIITKLPIPEYANDSKLKAVTTGNSLNSLDVIPDDKKEKEIRRLNGELLSTRVRNIELENENKILEGRITWLHQQNHDLERERRPSPERGAKITRLYGLNVPMERELDEMCSNQPAADKKDEPAEYTNDIATYSVDFAILRTEIAMREMVYERSLLGMQDGDTDAAIRTGREALQRAQEIGSEPLVARSHFWLALAYFYTGRFDEGSEHITRGHALVDWDTHQEEYEAFMQWREIGERFRPSQRRSDYQRSRVSVGYI
ncbi:hypothetical protein BGZ60DRAFT_268943 [Tricladium varicosporioides]|nr:hypothetical protein BGZ60DRAFT_268943 [Hymenoscyphus varicosporioides]